MATCQDFVIATYAAFQTTKPVMMIATISMTTPTNTPTRVAVRFTDCVPVVEKDKIT